MSRFRLLCIALAATPVALAAQTIPVPLSNSSIVPETPVPTPTPSPTPRPSPSPTATPRATPTPRVSPTPRATASPRATPTPTPSATPSPTPTPSPRASASPSPSPIASAAVTSTPEPPIETVVLPQRPRGGEGPLLPIWAWFAGGALLLAALAALLLRRRADSEEALEEEPGAPEPAAATRPPQLLIELRPTRAGVNLLSATVEGEVAVTNAGDVVAADVRVAVTLLGGGAGADDALDQLATSPITATAVPPFTLAPGAERRFRAVAVLPLDLMEPLMVAERPMFVPLVAITAQWMDPDALARRVTRGFAVGVERVDSAKLAPLWLDVPPRTYDAVAARPHGPARET